MKFFLQGKDTGEVVETVSLRRHCTVLKGLAACYSHCLLHRPEKFARVSLASICMKTHLYSHHLDGTYFYSIHSIDTSYIGSLAVYPAETRLRAETDDISFAGLTETISLHDIM